jgi:phosphotransferase system HPr (HPr) family protein
VRNQPGIHARPAALFVKKAGEFDSEVFVTHGELEVNGKSIMGVMMLAAEAGTELLISASGPDEEEAVAALVRLVDSRFGEDKET